MSAASPRMAIPSTLFGPRFVLFGPHLQDVVFNILIRLRLHQHALSVDVPSGDFRCVKT